MESIKAGLWGRNQYPQAEENARDLDIQFICLGMFRSEIFHTVI